MTSFESYLKSVGEVGRVVSANNVLVMCEGLPGAKVWEKIVFETGQIGIVNAILSTQTRVLLLDSQSVSIGSSAVRTKETFKVKVSKNSLGRVVDVFGEPIDGRGKLASTEERYPDSTVPPIIDRVRINQNLETGVTLVDLLLPLGKGQRQLIIGDQKVGKTTFLLQVIARQTALGTVCVYASIGKKKSDLASVVDRLSKLGAFSKSVVVAAPASLPTSLIYLAPFTAFSIAEYFRDMGFDVLLVLDEISRHAKYFRELSILSKKMPGRDGYPGDIFYLHSHLMERAGRFMLSSKSADSETLTLKIKGKTASITCLPVVETVGSDFTGYISTNLISMTDGHLFFDVDTFQTGLRPAINVGLSVTRVGRQTLKTIEREISFKVRDILFDYGKAQDVAKFGVELLESTQKSLSEGEKLMAILEQRGDVVVPRVLQLLFVQMLFSSFWDGFGPSDIRAHKDVIYKAYVKGEVNKLTRELETSIDLGSIRRFEKVVFDNKGALEALCGIKRT
ncbi:MAG: hypothetical protein NUV69_05845 [Candidatus Curtissbacteria bacterium]|nr:hypothetical protein [Candidatus Curtissbacteria bacterium]